MGRSRVVFAGHDLKFAKDLIQYFQEREAYEVKIDKWESHDSHNEDYSFECIEWADLIFCEWGLGNAVWYSLNKKENQKMYVRMHRQELDTDFPNHINLKNVEKIIAISPYIYEELYRAFRFPREKMSMIFNYVNMDKFDLPKQQNAKFNIGMIGICPMMKRLDIALDAFEDLWRKNNNYKLFIKGKMPQEYSWIWNNEEQREYYEKVFERIEKSEWKNSVYFDGFGENVGEWLQKIGVILSVSDFESFHLAVAEGMSSGAIPVIKEWEGVNTIYDNSIIVKKPDEIVKQIEYICSLEEKAYIELQEEMKQYSKIQFSFENIVKEYVSLFSD